jgi:hypothetical protein
MINPERACNSIRTVACFSISVSDGGLSSIPRCASVLSRSIFFRATAIPISALSKLLRTEASSVRLTVSPQSTTTTPCATTISAVEWSAFARSCATVSAASDQPASEAGMWRHSAPGNTLSAFAR